MELVADFLGGVRRGRELRNARELAECLVAMGVVPSSGVTQEQATPAHEDTDTDTDTDTTEYITDIDEIAHLNLMMAFNGGLPGDMDTNT